MDREKFTSILGEYNYSDRQIEHLWNARPSNRELNEDRLRETARAIAPIKDTLNSHVCTNACRIGMGHYHGE